MVIKDFTRAEKRTEVKENSLSRENLGIFFNINMIRNIFKQVFLQNRHQTNVIEYISYTNPQVLDNRSRQI